MIVLDVCNTNLIMKFANEIVLDVCNTNLMMKFAGLYFPIVQHFVTEVCGNFRNF